MIQVSSAKKEKMADLAEKVLHFAGQLMTCVEDMENGEMGERTYRNSRYSMGRRDMDDWDEDEMGERWRAYGDRRRYR